MRRQSPRLGERFNLAVDTDPIDLRDIRRAAPPRPPAVHQPFAAGRRPGPPVPPARVKVFGAPIPEPHVADPDPGVDPSLLLARVPWARVNGITWTPRLRRRLRLAALLCAGIGAAGLVVLAAVSMAGGG
ncbi:MAG: hypothetical protein IPG94_05630 [Kineosporiaceae bacterium]|nr:hypothetical protein [Kineosporiaceae bacterium]